MFNHVEDLPTREAQRWHLPLSLCIDINSDWIWGYQKLHLATLAYGVSVFLVQVTNKHHSYRLNKVWIVIVNGSLTFT